MNCVAKCGRANQCVAHTAAASSVSTVDSKSRCLRRATAGAGATTNVARPRRPRDNAAPTEELQRVLSRSHSATTNPPAVLLRGCVRIIRCTGPRMLQHPVACAVPASIGVRGDHHQHGRSTDFAARKKTNHRPTLTDGKPPPAAWDGCSITAGFIMMTRAKRRALGGLRKPLPVHSHFQMRFSGCSYGQDRQPT